MSSIEKCAFCDVEATLRCGGCANAFYCSLDHQKQHWKLHKLTCKAFEVVQNTDTNENGQFLRAARNISAKSVILSEFPLIVAPKWSLTEAERNHAIFPCVGCFTATRINVYRCPKCRWPACANDCSELGNPNGHQLECELLSLRETPDEFKDSAEFLDFYHSDALFVLKCLMLQRTEPRKWKQLMEMESYQNKRKFLPVYRITATRIAQYLDIFYMEPLRELQAKTNKSLLPDSSLETIHHICGLMEVHSSIVGSPCGQQELSVLHPTAIIMEQSCTPNTKYSFDPYKRYKIELKSARNIQKGEHLTTIYTHMLWGTQMRREHLRMSRYFDCSCPRCSDPTELGTYFSAIKCMGVEFDGCPAGEGILMPLDPLSEISEWACNMCTMRLQCDDVKCMLRQINDEVDEVVLEPNVPALCFQHLIDKLSQVLHANHYILFALKHSVIQLYGHQEGYGADEIGEEVLNNKIELCNELLKITTTLDPFNMRLALHTGIILYELHSAMLQLMPKKMQHELIAVEEKFVNRAAEYLKKAKKTLEDDLETPQTKVFYEKVLEAEEELLIFIS